MTATNTDDTAVDVLILSEDTPLAHALANLFELMGWTCGQTTLTPDSDHPGYWRPRISEPIGRPKSVLFVHSAGGKFSSFQGCCLAAKLRCPPVHCSAPALVWADQEAPLTECISLVHDEDLAHLGIVAERIPSCLQEFLSRLQYSRNISLAPLFWHERCLPIWVILADQGFLAIAHDLGRAFRNGDTDEALELSRLYFGLFEDIVTRSRRWTMSTKYVLLIDDSLAPKPQGEQQNSPVVRPSKLMRLFQWLFGKHTPERDTRSGQAESFTVQLTRELNRVAHERGKDIRYRVLPVSSFVRTDVVASFEDLSGLRWDKENPPLVVMDLNTDGLIREGLARAQEPSLTLLKEFAVATPPVKGAVWSAVSSGPAYNQAMYVNRWEVFSKFNDKPTDVAHYLISLH